MQGRAEDFRTRLDGIRRGLLLEPRGSDIIVGALLTPPVAHGSVAGALFFNNAGILGMCGHGTIGVAETLSHLGRIEAGEYQIDTVVGPITFTRSPNGEVALQNVESYRFAKGVRVSTPEFGEIKGDVAYGGNWFFLVHHEHPPLAPENIAELTRLGVAIRKALSKNGVTGANGVEIDHIELTDASSTPGVDARNFVLCPGLAFDRSPCGTGTSAKLACLAEDGLIAPGAVWTQESITGGIFRGSVQPGSSGWVPTIRGRAFVTAESTLIFQENDPYREGLGY